MEKMNKKYLDRFDRRHAVHNLIRFARLPYYAHDLFCFGFRTKQNQGKLSKLKTVQQISKWNFAND